VSVMKIMNKEEDIVVQSSMNILEGSLDESKMTVEACVLAPCISGNKRYYSPDIVKQLSEHLVGLKSYADHDDRSAKNTIGKIIGAKFEDNKAYATFKFSKAKDIAESIFTRIKEGIITDVSIAASGKTKRVKMNNEWVDEVLDISPHSVDFVSDGGVPEAKVTQVFESNQLPIITIGEEENMEKLEELTKQNETLIAEKEKMKVDYDAAQAELAGIKTKIQEKELSDLRARLIAEIQEKDEVKKLISEKITGTTEEELKKSISDVLGFIKTIKEAHASITGNPPVDTKTGKKFTSSAEVLSDTTLTETQKGEILASYFWGK